MIFDHEAAILARLAAKCAPGSRLLGTFDVVDFSDTSTTPVVGQVRLSGIEPAGQTGTSARVHIAWSFDVYVDLHRASPAEKTAAAALLALPLALDAQGACPHCGTALAGRFGAAVEKGFGRRRIPLRVAV